MIIRRIVISHLVSFLKMPLRRLEIFMPRLFLSQKVKPKDNTIVMFAILSKKNRLKNTKLSVSLALNILQVILKASLLETLL